MIWLDTGHGCNIQLRLPLQKKFKKIGLDADEATYREKRREYKFTISKKNISSVQNYCDQALLDNKNKKLGETVSHVRQKKKHQKISIRTWQDHFQTILGQAGEKQVIKFKHKQKMMYNVEDSSWK